MSFAPSLFQSHVAKNLAKDVAQLLQRFLSMSRKENFLPNPCRGIFKPIKTSTIMDSNHRVTKNEEATCLNFWDYPAQCNLACKKTFHIASEIYSRVLSKVILERSSFAFEQDTTLSGYYAYWYCQLFSIADLRDRFVL